MMNSWLNEMDNSERDARIGDIVLNYPERVQSAGGDATFAAWLFEVDQLLIERVMIDHANMTDWKWHDTFADDYSPSDAVNEFLDGEISSAINFLCEEQEA